MDSRNYLDAETAKRFDEILPAVRAGGSPVLLQGPRGEVRLRLARGLAAAVGGHLQAVDLWQIASRYIGETEKNLDALFSRAAAENAVLFFDEADALFGKRTEVADAHDRYANLEVGYLLDRAEKARGLVILATNAATALDAGLSRRMLAILRHD